MRMLLSTLIVFLVTSLVMVQDADARRFGGGRSLGRQYSTMPRSAPQAVPSRPQSAAPRPNPAASGASRWLGPLAGLAAGGLLASLFFGDGFQGLQFMDILVIAALIFGGIALFRAMRRGGPAAASVPGYGGPTPGGRPGAQGLGSTEDVFSAVGAGEASGTFEVPAWFDQNGFVAAAKSHFIRLQAAWDRGDLRDIRDYVMPELFAALQQERQSLGPGPQYTEVVTLDAELLAARREGDQVVASVVFSGLIREEEGAIANRLREAWHVQHRWDTREGDWCIAGIQQLEE
jgi:predicted lipid-binding transport protein (Tim44 family)